MDEAFLYERYLPRWESVFPVRLTGRTTVDGKYVYSGKEMVLDPTDRGGLAVANPGRTFSSGGVPLYEINNTQVDVTSTPIVWARCRGSEGGAIAYEFDIGIPGSTISLVDVGTATGTSPYYNGRLVTYDGTTYTPGSSNTIYLIGSVSNLVETTRTYAQLVGTKTLAGGNKPVYRIMDGWFLLVNTNTAPDPDTYSYFLGKDRVVVDLQDGLYFTSDCKLNLAKADVDEPAGTITNQPQALAGNKCFDDHIKVNVGNGAEIRFTPDRQEGSSDGTAVGRITYDDSNDRLMFFNDPTATYPAAFTIETRPATLGQLGIWEYTGLAGTWAKLRVYNGDGSSSRVGNTVDVGPLQFSGGVLTFASLTTVASGTFLSHDGKTVTVVDGFITSIV